MEETMERSESKFYSVEDIMMMLHICRGTAYNLIKSNVFKSVRVGKRGRYMIVKESFNKWLENPVTEANSAVCV